MINFSHPGPEQSFVQIHTEHFCIAVESRFNRFIKRIHIGLLKIAITRRLSADIRCVLVDRPSAAMSSEAV